MDLNDWIEKLKAEQPYIIVEGLKDKRALSTLGLKKIITLKAPLYKIVEKVAAETKEVIILTDLDREGKKLFARLRKDLQKHRVRIDNKFREFLFKETKLRQIEGITKYISKFDNSTGRW